MRIEVELFGVVRRRAGVGTIQVEFGGEAPRSLAEVLEQLANQYADLCPDCLVRHSENGWSLTPHLIANINGQRFTRDGTEPLVDGDHLLLLSADVGG